MDDKPYILVVDDTPAVLELLVGLLGDAYNLKIAQGGEKALRYIEKNSKIDLILLDVMMPDMDGFEVCRIIKENPKLKHIPIIFLTVLEKESDIIKGFDNGAVDYVIKPFEPLVLKARVKTHIELKRLRDIMVQDLEEKEALLFAQSKMAQLGEMFENIAHQWKQPLSIISLSSSSIRLDLEFGNLEKKEVLKGLDTLDRAVEHMSQTMLDFKDFIHESTKAEFFDIHEIINKTINLISSKLSHTVIQIENNTQNTRVYTYKNEFIQVLMNILNNAIDSLEQKKEARIHIHSSLHGDDIKIKICDNGSGIEPKIADTLFDKYVSTKKMKDGSGVGLYMSKKIMQERIKGSIYAFNVQSGEAQSGACFELIFPLHAKENETIGV